MFSLFTILSAVTLVVRRQYGILSCTLEESIRYLMIRGINPFNGDTGGEFTQVQGVPVGEPIPSTYFPLLMMQGEYGAITHGGVRWSPCGGSADGDGITVDVSDTEVRVALTETDDDFGQPVWGDWIVQGDAVTTTTGATSINGHRGEYEMEAYVKVGIHAWVKYKRKDDVEYQRGEYWT